MPNPSDDRRNQCAVARLTNRQLAWRSVGIKSFTKDELIKQEQEVTVKTEVGIALVGGVFGWVLWTAVLLPMTPLGSTLLGHFIVPFAVSVAVSTLLWFSTLSRVRVFHFDKISEIHLRHGRCPACSYHLSGLQTESDGCFICPECSAAWNACRVVFSNDG